MLVVELDLPDPEILFSCVYTLGVLYTNSPTLGFKEVPQKRGFRGKFLEKCFWDVCWPIVLRTHGIGLTVVFSHGISPIK